MEQRSTRPAFLILFVLLIAAFGRIAAPFATPALLALLIVIICHPVYHLLLRIFRERRYIASFSATLFAAMCIVAPLGIIVGVIISNLSDVINYVTSQLQGGQMASAVDEANLWLAARLAEYASWLPADFDLRAALVGLLTSAGKVVYQYSPKVVSATAQVVGGLALMIIFIFGLFAEGPKVYQNIISLLPLEDKHKEILTREIRQVISGTFLGMIATAVVQGMLIGIGFAVAGIANPFVWGLVAVGVTLIPVAGGPLMYLPAAAAMFISGKTGTGLFILAYGIGIVSTVDNVIKPLVMRGKVNVHPLLLALALVGGVMWLGPIGIVAGPLVVALLLSMVKIYQREFI